jgi:peptidoglycan/xylan/chitin deacetylase (PgdA/CDA1 family)
MEILNRTDTVVLGYHAVSRAWPSSLAVTPARLEQQVKWLLARGFRGTTFYEAVVSPPARKSFAVTFDDGYRSVLLEGLPVLRRLGVPGTVFPNIAYVDSERLRVGPALQHWLGSAYEAELESMTWDEIRQLSEAGWEIGSHTVTHPYLTEIDDVALDRELRDSKGRLEREIGRPCRTIAYPSGNFDDRVARVAAVAAYEVAGALPRRLPSHPDRLAWPRISISRDDNRVTFALKVSPVVRRLRQTHLWLTVDDLRIKLSRGPNRAA